MKAVGVIPARFASTRFPGKPLELVAGRPLLQWVVEAAKKAKLLEEVIVATDHEGILQLAQSLGIQAVMTPSDLATGSDRVNYIISERKDVDVVINIQGDEPLLRPTLLDELVQALRQDPQADMVTAARHIQEVDTLLSPHTAKVVLNQQQYALYFSRLPIPYSRRQAHEDLASQACLKHIGIYAYRKKFLQRFCAQPPVAIESLEGLEQLRALYLGAKMRVLQVTDESWGVDIPSDVQKIEEIMERLNNGSQKN